MSETPNNPLRPTTGISVTDHAILRRLQHTNSRWGQETKILRIIMEGEEIEPKRKLAKLLNNKFADARYYERGGLVAVVANMKVVTVYPYTQGNWREIGDS